MFALGWYLVFLFNVRTRLVSSILEAMLVVKILRFSPAVRPILAVFCADARVRTARLTAPVRAAAGAVGPPRVPRSSPRSAARSG
jgi:hypothetical protein